MSKSILQSWVTELGLRHQGVLLTAVRGCDVWSKHAPEKPLIRELRGLVLNPFDQRELNYPNGFMTGFNLEWSRPAFTAFCDQIDSLPVHYVMHLLHAIQIIGYCHPSDKVRGFYELRYYVLVEKFHLKPETEDEMNRRLTEDRIKEGTVEA